MKNFILITVAIIAFASCKNKKTQEKKSQDVSKILPISDAVIETSVIYEVNIRQYSKEGTFNEFTKDIPQLKKLGIKIIWLMPIFPISETKRKATGGDFASKIKDPKERKKALGSYYAVSDFTKINPEFGSISDFRNLVKVAHNNNMYVILDWVPNHTGWDHTWLKSNPEFYTKNSKGEITEPLNKDGSPVGWGDVADLNYDNKGLRKEMIKEMSHWITKENIDGFRCDAAGFVPTDFWQEAIPKLRAKKDIFMLAEAWEPELLKNNLFDMAYNWGTYHTINNIAQSKANVNAWKKRMSEIDSLYEKNDILMNFITNHDENSWSGTVNERLKNAAEVMLVLSYMTPGMPLIYSGQEYDLNHRLKFFEKDSIPKIKGKMWTLLEKLGKLKNFNVALNGGKNAAAYKNIETNNEHVLSFVRKKNNRSIVFIANLSNTHQTIKNILKGKYKNYITDKSIVFKEGNFELNPWDYLILEKINK